jgi:hypothetical protein
MHDDGTACASCSRADRLDEESFVPHRLSSASPLSVVALAAFGAFVFAGSQAHASNFFRGVSIHSSTPIAQLPTPPVHLVPPPHVHPLPPPHWSGGFK